MGTYIPENPLKLQFVSLPPKLLSKCLPKIKHMLNETLNSLYYFYKGKYFLTHLFL